MAFSIMVRADPTGSKERDVDLSTIKMEQFVMNVQKEIVKAIQKMLEVNITANATCEFFGVVSDCKLLLVEPVTG